MSTTELRIPRDPAFVGLARLVVAQAARLAGVPQDRVEDVKIAVAEALANATGSDRFGDSDAPIELRFGRTSGGFEVVVLGLDHPTSDVNDTEHPGLDLLDPKLSFTLIEGLTDEFSHEPDGDLMRLRFVVGTS
jgi:anti-sigma regulatory factor (Ser/Thr protein kinase)